MVSLFVFVWWNEKGGEGREAEWGEQSSFFRMLAGASPLGGLAEQSSSFGMLANASPLGGLAEQSSSGMLADASLWGGLAEQSSSFGMLAGASPWGGEVLAVYLRSGARFR